MPEINKKKIRKRAKILWQRKRLGKREKSCNRERKTIFFYYYCWHFIWLLCVICRDKMLEPAHTPSSIKMIWCKYEWDWIFLASKHFSYCSRLYVCKFSSFATTWKHSLIACPLLTVAVVVIIIFDLYERESCDYIAATLHRLPRWDDERKSLTYKSDWRSE